MRCYMAMHSKAIANANIRRLEEFNLTVSALGSADEPLTQKMRIDLYHGKITSTAHSRRRIIGMSSVALLAVSAIVFGVSWYGLSQEGQRLGELDATLAKARNRLVQATGSTTRRDQDFAYIATKTPVAARFHIMDRLAAILPDGTFLDGLDIGPEDVRLAGTSTEASDLIRLLENEPMFLDAKFSAPIIRQDDGRDRFEITAAFAAKHREPVQ
jgi:general secretion pathway protein L